MERKSVEVKWTTGKDAEGRLALYSTTGMGGRIGKTRWESFSAPAKNWGNLVAREHNLPAERQFETLQAWQ